MAFVSGCDHDVFISYSRANNHADWVTRFHKQLEARLRERVSAEIDVFRDPELSGNQGLTDELKRRLRSSAVVVAVVSRSYLQRPWCQLEIDEFRKAAAQRGVTGCIFPVRYDDVRPEEFVSLLGHDFLGYEFCGPVDDSGMVVEFATDSESFKQALLKLRGEIAGQLEQLQSRAATSPPGGKGKRFLPTPALSDRPVVFLAEPPRALAAQRDELAAFLKEGFGMDTIQPGANFHERDEVQRLALDRRQRLRASQSGGAKPLTTGNVAKLFVSYRRDDNPYAAQMIYKELSLTFGPDSVFFDVDSIPPGVDFVDYINDKVAETQVLLAIIGDKWLNARDENGQRRLDNPSDFVRVEIEAALERKIPVIPVLIDHAKVPRENELPAGLTKLARRNATEVRQGRDFESHLARLVEDVKRSLQMP